MAPVADAPTPIPLRPSDDERERIAAMLRASSVAGRISVDTLSERAGRALEAKHRGELADLVVDVRAHGPARRALMRVVEAWSRLAIDVQAAWRRPRLPALALPARAGAGMTLGRSRECDCVIWEPTVSRRHAELRGDGGRWLLRDLGSRNGTRVNGLRVLEETEVRPGDRIALGEARYRLALPR
jgi:predicted component of type VI protein secretion system